MKHDLSEKPLHTFPDHALAKQTGAPMRKAGRFVAFAASATLMSVVSLLPLASRAEETAHPKTTGYPAVGDVPPRPDKPAMTADEQSKLKKELSAARDRQPKGNSTGKASAGAAPAKP
jgi:hypothetical protein